MIRFLLCLTLPVSVFAGSLTLSLDDLPTRVRSSHPILHAARLTIDEARGRHLGSGRLANPSLETDFQNQSQVSPQVVGIGLDQSFPLTHRLRLEKQLTAHLVTSAEHEVREVERRLIAEAQSLAVRWLSLKQQQALRQQQAQLAEELAAFTQNRAAAGETSSLDATQARVDAQRLLLDTRKLDADLVALIGQLKTYLSLASTDTLTLRGPLPPVSLPTTADWQQRPDFQLAQHQQTVAQTETELAKRRRWQDISVGLFAAHERQDVSSSRTDNTGFVGVRLSIPLPLWNRNQGEIAEKTATAERQRLQTAALANQITNEAATARNELTTLLSLIRETETDLLPLLTEQTTTLEKAYEAGQTDLLSLLRAREQSLQIRNTLLEATRDFHLARIRHQSALGNSY